MRGDWLRDMQLFVGVAQARNFGRAALALGMPASTLSRRIAALERSLGVRLLNRSTRRVELTEDGEVYLRRVVQIVEDAIKAHEEIRERDALPRGHLRIAMMHGLAAPVGMQWLAEFALLHPHITFELSTVPEHVDLIADRFDVAVRSREPRDSQLHVRRVASFSRYLYASPAYVAAHGAPAHPRELAQHECIRYTDERDTWALHRADEQVSVAVHGRFVCDEPQNVRPLAFAGLGIVLLVHAAGIPDEAAGRLVQLLPEWRSETFSAIYVVTPTRIVPKRTQLFIDFLTEKIRGIPA